MSARVPVEVVLTSDRFESDPVGRELAEIVCSDRFAEKLGGSVLYYDFPTYADYETVAYTPTALLLSPTLGAIAISAITGFELASGNKGNIAEVEASILQFSSILIGRLLKSKILRRSVGQLKFEVTPVVYLPGAPDDCGIADARLISSEESFATLLDDLNVNVLSDEEIAEARSVIEGAKALIRPVRRAIDDPSVQVVASALARLEAEIANFDQKQRRAALSTVPGPQRIRGLAGSGKTIILAMKAAHLHAKYPDANILVTFYTKSLRETIRSLITKFYRHYRDVDPDWERVHVLHGWGGSRRGGVYSDAAKRAGISPLNLQEAKLVAQKGEDAFEAACRTLVESRQVTAYYDYCLIDEGQDFPSTFYRLVYLATRGERDKKSIIWAYDELQNILDVKLRSPAELFGTDENGDPMVSLERAAMDLPRGAENDVVLSKCYRNQREVLVVAHALGFGIYSDIVQLLESREHWEDVGYSVVEGDLTRVGSEITIERPVENSPLSVGAIEGHPLIGALAANDFEAECDWVVHQVRSFIAGGLRPHDIMIVTLDDRASRAYFKRLSDLLSAAGIGTHNLLGDPYSDPPFFVDDRITLSTIYRAKGNEAPAVLAIGIDAASTRTRQGRNKIFTAFTRSKAWLRVSGVGGTAATFINEINRALELFPKMVFRMPDLRRVELIQRDLTKKQAEIKRIRDEYLLKLREQGFSEDEALDLLEVDQRGTTSIRG